MELTFNCRHGQYSPATLLVVSAIYSALVLILGAFLKRVARMRHPFFWLSYGVVAWVPLLVVAGQHIPVLEAFAPGQYCFGDPTLLHIICLALPAVAVTFAAAWPPRPVPLSEGEA